MSKTQEVTVSFTLTIDVDEWTAQFPEENTPEVIQVEASAHAECMVRDHYYDQGWTVER